VEPLADVPPSAELHPPADISPLAEVPLTTAEAGTSTIGGPSFLGSSEVPQVAAESAMTPVNEKSSASHWRGWLVAAVLLIFAGSGLMEWRAQVRQTNNGPVEIISRKIRNWKHALAPALAPASQTAPTTPSAGSNPNPEIPVQAQNQDQSGSVNAPEANAPDGAKAAMIGPVQASPNTSDVTAAAAPQTTAPNLPATTQKLIGPKPFVGPPTTTAQNSTAARTQQPAAGATTPTAKPSDNANSSSAQVAAKTAADKSKTARPAEESSSQESSSKPLGAEEMVKAYNASDSAAAASWLWKATAKGNPDAPVQLAEMYIRGDGVPRSCEQAMVLLKTAAVKENARARNRLASMYASGECVQRNRVDAYRWLSSALAANPGSDWAQQSRDLLWQQMTPEERQMAAKYR
jgi:DNA polymerase III gamma/tau subunit